MLLDLFGRIENVFRLLETYIEVPQTEIMTDAIVKVMADVLCILAIATRDINQSRASEFLPGDESILFVYISLERFLRKLGRRKDIEVALQRLEKVTVEEARRVANEVLKATHGVDDKAMDIDHEVHGVRGPQRAVGGVSRPMERNLDYLSGS